MHTIDTYILIGGVGVKIQAYLSLLKLLNVSFEIIVYY